LVYGGDSIQRRENVTEIPWNDLEALREEL
jgi:hypothetical protein